LALTCEIVGKLLDPVLKTAVEEGFQLAAGTEYRAVNVEHRRPLIVLRGKLVVNGQFQGAALTVEHRLFEAKNAGEYNSTAVRDAQLRSEMLSIVKRADKDLVSPFPDGFFGGRSQAIDGHVVFYQICVTDQHVALDLVFEREFAEDWKGSGLITDRCRCYLQLIVTGVTRILDSGFRFTQVDPSMLGIDMERGHVQLMHLGLGAIVEQKAALCNRGGKKQRGPQVMFSRRTTSRCVEMGGPTPKSVNWSRFNRLNANAAKGATAAMAKTSLKTAVKAVKTVKAAKTAKAKASRKTAEIVPKAAKAAKANVSEEMEINGGPDLLSCEATAAIKPQESSLNRVLSCEQAVRLSAADVASSVVKSREREVGLIALRSEESLFIYECLHPLRSGDIHDMPAQDRLRLSDQHQIVAMISRFFQPQSDWKDALKTVLDASNGVDIRLIENLIQFLDPDRKCHQRATISRLADFLARNLHPSARKQAVEEWQDMDLISFPALGPDQEAMIAGEGIRIELAMYPLSDPEFMALARAKLTCDELQGTTPEEPEGGPRQALLINEEGKGCGVKAIGKYSRKSFAMWYVGKKRMFEASGRYVVTVRNGVEYCDGAPCLHMTVDDILKYRAPGCFVNSESVGRCNLKLLRKQAFEYKGNIWIPMAVKGKRDIEDGEYFSWDYDDKALKGRAR